MIWLTTALLPLSLSGVEAGAGFDPEASGVPACQTAFAARLEFPTELTMGAFGFRGSPIPWTGAVRVRPGFGFYSPERRLVAGWVFGARFENPGFQGILGGQVIFRNRRMGHFLDRIDAGLEFSVADRFNQGMDKSVAAVFLADAERGRIVLRVGIEWDDDATWGVFELGFGFHPIRTMRKLPQVAPSRSPTPDFADVVEFELFSYLIDDLFVSGGINCYDVLQLVNVTLDGPPDVATLQQRMEDNRLPKWAAELSQVVRRAVNRSQARDIPVDPSQIAVGLARAVRRTLVYVRDSASPETYIIDHQLREGTNRSPS